MKSVVIAGFAAISLLAAYGAGASEELAKKNGCLNCHAMDQKKVGPSVKDIAAKHKGKADVDALTAKLMSGKGHPKTKSSEDDVKKIIGWMTSL